MEKFEICYIDSDKAVCYGEEKIGGHPKVYLKIEPSTQEVICPYCSKKFIKKL